MAKQPNILVILIDDLRYDEFGAGGHPYMKTPHIDRIAHEGALFERAFHTTPICSPNRASILTGQYASRHGIIDNVARDLASHRIPNYHVELQRLGYETAHIGKWHMGNSGKPRPGYDFWVAYDGHGRLNDPKLNEHGEYVQRKGYVTDIMNEMAVDFVKRKHAKPWSLWFAHKAVHPDAEQAADGTFRMDGYVAAERHKDLYRGCVFPKKPNMLPPAEVVKQKPAWAEAIELRKTARVARAARRDPLRRAGGDPPARGDDGRGRRRRRHAVRRARATGQLDNTFILFLGDNGYFFGEHCIGPERRFAYEEGIRSPFLVRYPGASRPARVSTSSCCARTSRRRCSSSPAASRASTSRGARCCRSSLAAEANAGWRKSFLIEYWAENAYPWLVNMTYKAVRTDALQVHPLGEPQPQRRARRALRPRARPVRDRQREQAAPAYRAVREKLQRELRRLTTEALGI